MKRITVVLFAFVLISCGEALSGDKFSGDWKLSKESPMYVENPDKYNKIEVKITKGDVFYNVDFIIDGKDFYTEALSHNETPEVKALTEQMHKYQLSPDKRFLVNIVEPSNVIIYNDDNHTIQTLFGWFVKQ